MTNITGAEAPIEKYAGILAHPTSFPGPYGIGDLGNGAYRFIDFLEKSGLNLWQVLTQCMLSFSPGAIVFHKSCPGACNFFLQLSC